VALAAAIAGLSILIIGDSHLSQPSYLMSSLHDDLQRQGAKVHSIGVCGVQPYDWTVSKPGSCGSAERIGNKPAVVSPGNRAKTTAVAQLIKAEHPDLVLIVLGDTMAATAISGWGWLYGFSCSRASWRVNPSVCIVTVSPRRRRMIASRHCSIRGRCSSAGIPSMCASDVS